LLLSVAIAPSGFAIVRAAVPASLSFPFPAEQPVSISADAIPIAATDVIHFFMEGVSSLSVMGPAEPGRW
jgi:hypothetical protein